MNAFKITRITRKSCSATKVFFMVLAVFIAVSVMQTFQLNNMLSHVRAIETEVEYLSLERQSIHSDLNLR